MTREEKIARFLGYEEDPDPDFGWMKPDGSLDLEFHLDKFTTDLNLFTEAWNKAYEEFKESDKDVWDKFSIWEDINLLSQSFHIETRLPLLIRIIDFLAEVKAMTDEPQKNTLQAVEVVFTRTQLGQPYFVHQGAEWAGGGICPHDWSVSQLRAIADYMEANQDCSLFPDGSGEIVKP